MTVPPPEAGDAGRGFYPSEGAGFDLEDRQALRRVPGLATELADVSEVEYRQLRLERVVLIGVWTSGSAAEAETSLAELAALARTAGSLVLEGVIQRRSKPDAASYVGSGKARELRDIVAATGADTVVVDGELAPGQLRKLEDVVKVKVIDRTALILDIFAQHATSREGKAQVELAQLEYLLPRLRGWGESLSRLGGGIGTRGPGETKIETDRRRIRARMARLRREIDGIGRVRATKRSARVAAGVPAVAIVGYTNAGKSSILNRLTGAGVLVEDALFATLDPTVRRAALPDGRTVTLADTVGFVRHLPHQLVEAFRSTLDEARGADVLLHVVDGSAVDPEAEIQAVRDVLGTIGASGLSEVTAVNKADTADPYVLARLRRAIPDAVMVSARTGAGLGALVDALAAALPRPPVRVRALVPYAQGALVARVHRDGEVLEASHEAAGTLLSARVGASLAAELAPYAVADTG
ncbi:MAG: GTPase HflX [Mycobacteriales bacterium]